jgi:putative nucleotidyltransferase with HDIG domain
MNEEEAAQLVKENIENTKLLNHSFAVESIMRGIAEYLHEDVRLWGMCGLLHDIDFEKIKGDPGKHGIAAEDILRGNVDERVIRAIRAHNGENTGTVPESAMERCLISTDSVSGLLIASTLVMPTKKIKDLRLETVLRKFRDLDFASGCSRERMRACESTGVPIKKLFEISLSALQAISDKLGL